MDVPRELASRKQWVCWKGKKIPFSPNGTPAKSNDPATWSSLADCQAATGYSGIGYVFSPDDPFCGIDLDGCYNQGEIEPWAAEIIEAFPSYAEVSPSGRGIKLWIRGKLPDGRGRKKEIGTGQAVELYDRGRYFCFTGQALGDLAISDCQQALDALLARLWPVVAPAAPVRPADDVAGRAAAYVAKIEGVTSGQNRGTRTLQVAAVLVRGFCLGINDALPIIRDWNARCSPNDWPQDRIDKELLRKLRDADKHAGERGWLLNGREYTGPDADLRALLARLAGGEQQAAVKSPDIPTSPLTFPQDCLRPPGLLSQVIDWNLQTALWPQPELALAGALALLGTITGRKVQDTRRTRTNVYCLGLAASGAGKEHARTVNKEIMIRAGADKMLGPEGIASSAGMIQFVNSQQSILFQLDEVGRLLETMRDPRKAPHLFKIGSELMKLDSCSNTLYKGDAYANQKQSVVINQPHCCIYGTSVPRGFWESLTDDNVSEGLLGRMFVFESGRRYVDIATPEHSEPPAELLDSVRWWLDRPYGPGDVSEQNPSPMVIPFAPEAQRRLDEHMKGICQQRAKEDDTRAALWSRTTGKTAKLALLLACSRETGSTLITIQLEDVERAIKISNWLTRRMIWQAYRHVSHNEREGASKKILRMLSVRMTRSDLTRKTQWLDRRRREEIVSELIEAGLVTVETEETPKKHTQWLQAAT